MDNSHYSAERSVQLLISLLKQHNIKKVVASPGATNITFVASIQHDPFFEIYSSVDERSAAYIACGLAAESHEAVVLSCTGATASRNYIPGLTEAFYRKLPVLAVTSTQDISRVGQMIPQVIDRSSIQKDIALCSVHIPLTIDENSEWSNTIKLNRAILELKHRGGGPAHINLTTSYCRDFSVKEFPQAKMISRVCKESEFPQIPKGRIAIFIGSHVKFQEEEIDAIDHFCSSYNAVVFCDHTSGYKGKYKVLISLLASQDRYVCEECRMDLLIHIGEISGSYIGLSPRCVWRVSPDGEIRDYYKKLTCVFEMSELSFFKYYASLESAQAEDYLNECLGKLQECRNKISDNIPFSNVWIAQQTTPHLPPKSVLHLGILNTLRAWNLFEIPDDILVYSNTGGFGIDGCISSLVGASLANSDKLYFAVVGDLSFFYDMNVIGNRHVGNNVRLLLVNNGKGTEFRNYKHDGAIFGEETDKYIAAAGHFGNKSIKLVKHYAEDLGYEYLSAMSKDEYLRALERFVNPEITERPIIFEAFTNSEDESNALKLMYNIIQESNIVFKQKIKSALGEKGTNIVRKVLKK